MCYRYRYFVAAKQRKRPRRVVEPCFGLSGGLEPVLRQEGQQLLGVDCDRVRAAVALPGSQIPTPKDVAGIDVVLREPPTELELAS